MTDPKEITTGFVSVEELVVQLESEIKRRQYAEEVLANFMKAGPR